MNKASSRIRTEIIQEQCGFVKDTVKKRLPSLCMNLQKEQLKYKTICILYIYFIDYAKAIDKVSPKDLLKLPGKLDIFRKDKSMIEKLY